MVLIYRTYFTGQHRSTSQPHNLERNTYYLIISSGNEICTRIYYTISLVMILIMQCWFDFCNKDQKEQRSLLFQAYSLYHKVLRKHRETGWALCEEGLSPIKDEGCSSLVEMLSSSALDFCLFCCPAWTTVPLPLT